MDGPLVIPRGGGEVVGDAADRRVEILSDHEALNATWSRFAPGRDGAALHVHRHHSDLFYVLAGELTVRLGVEDRQVLVPAGRLVRVPPLVVHGFRNGGDAELRYLNFHAPGMRFADYLRAMRDGRPFAYDQHEPPADGGRPTDGAAIGAVERVAERDGAQVSVLADVREIAVEEVLVAGQTTTWRIPGDGDRVVSYYVLEGELALDVEGRGLRADAGSWLQLPPGTAHAGSAPARTRLLRVRVPAGAARGR